MGLFKTLGHLALAALFSGAGSSGSRSKRGFVPRQKQANPKSNRSTGNNSRYKRF